MQFMYVWEWCMYDSNRYWICLLVYVYVYNMYINSMSLDVLTYHVSVEINLRVLVGFDIHSYAIKTGPLS